MFIILFHDLEAINQIITYITMVLYALVQYAFLTKFSFRQHEFCHDFAASPSINELENL